MNFNQAIRLYISLISILGSVMAGSSATEAIRYGLEYPFAMDYAAIFLFIMIALVFLFGAYIFFHYEIKFIDFEGDAPS